LDLNAPVNDSGNNNEEDGNSRNAEESGGDVPSLIPVVKDGDSEPVEAKENGEKELEEAAEAEVPQES
jgi:hypothetical protein